MPEAAGPKLARDTPVGRSALKERFLAVKGTPREARVIRHSNAAAFPSRSITPSPMNKTRSPD
jgi:hypothetical protein